MAPRPPKHGGSGCLSWVLAPWTYLCLGCKLVVIVFRLTIYATLLMPGFLQMIVYYFFRKCVVRGIVYGPKSRNRLDLYFPPNAPPDAVYPVVIYLTGGAWTIGYRAWGALLGRRLSEQGVLVACLDYRNYPQGDALDMLEDVNTGIRWVLDRIHRFGGDPDSVTLVGQSAGGHLAGLALIKQAEQEALGQPALGASPAWSPTALRAFVGVSGAFDLVALAEHRGGTFRGLLDRILSVDLDADRPGAPGPGPGAGASSQALVLDMEAGSGAAAARAAAPAHAVEPLASRAGDARGGGKGGGGAAKRRARPRPAYTALSPLEAARRLPAAAAALLPYVLLVHGTADKTVPAEGSAKLSEALQSAGARCSRCLLVPGKTHTAFLLEDPMRGGRDLLSDTVLGAVTGGGADGGNGEGGAVVFGGGGSGGGVQPPAHVYGTLCPGWLCDLAGWVCPF